MNVYMFCGLISVLFIVFEIVLCELDGIEAFEAEI